MHRQVWRSCRGLSWAQAGVKPRRPAIRLTAVPVGGLPS